MLKRFLPLVCAVVLFSACENSNNYSQLLKQEELQIKAWLQREGITVIDVFPQDSLFAVSEMYHYPDGIYFQLLEKGEGDTLSRGDEIVLRYIQSTLDINPVVESYWTTQDRPIPHPITYGNLKYSCEGWQKAFELMKRTGAHARVIVPSKIGRDPSEVVPYLYEMKIKIAPK